MRQQGRTRGGAWWRVALVLAALVGSGCADARTLSAPGSVSAVPARHDTGQGEAHSPAPFTDSDGAAAMAPEAIEWLLRTERTAAAAGDVEALASLWAAAGQVRERRGSEEPAQWYVWAGRDAVMSRYMVAVFAHAPPPLEGDALYQVRTAIVAGLAAADIAATATAQELAESTVVEISNGGDRWRFIYEDGRWWILALSYSS